jgi:hypothetical protein
MEAPNMGRAYYAGIGGMIMKNLALLLLALPLTACTIPTPEQRAQLKATQLAQAERTLAWPRRIICAAKTVTRSISMEWRSNNRTAGHLPWWTSL